MSIENQSIIVQCETTPAGTNYRSIILNHPARRNSLSLNAIDNLLDCLRNAVNDSLLLTAAPPAFCAGLDLKEIIAEGSPEEHLRKLVTLLVEFANHPKATICYVKGPARAGGVALACCADNAIAHPDATFMIPGEHVYEPMAAILPPILAHRRNLPREKAESLPGCLLNAAAAKSIGLIDEVSKSQEEVLTALDRAVQQAHPVTAQQPQPATITPAILREINTRIDRAIKPSAVAPLIQHLRERFGDPG